jgi:hypothetical protein
MDFAFGEQNPAYQVRVLNEREARAGAGILLVVALVAFMHAVLEGNFNLIRIVVVAFFIDFFIRVLVNPRYAPSLVLGRIAVSNQQPEYVGAPQKRFAWAIGLALASAMLYLVVFQNMRGPATMLACVICLVLLFFETAFGICLGCKLYNIFNKEKAQLCPGGVCEIRQKEPIQKVSLAQLGALAAFFAVIVILPSQLPEASKPRGLWPAAIGQSEEERCKVPKFARMLGHEEMWKKHNSCK